MALMRLREFNEMAGRTRLGCFRYDVDLAIGGRRLMVGGWRNKTRLHARQGSDPLDKTGPADGVAESPFVGNNRNFIQNVGNAAGFAGIASNGAVGCRVDMVNITRV